ncbi:hypothetical protein [Asanoa sp. NPDC050611]|uniref:hypothetical protein n=1 Tax=Asanoa sp. NPDC050611 TaxID=3157098 RepID=UPI0033C3C257
MPGREDGRELLLEPQFRTRQQLGDGDRVAATERAGFAVTLPEDWDNWMVPSGAALAAITRQTARR